MIIGEKNLIIGKLDDIISETSKSAFFYIQKQFNYLIENLNLFLLKVIPASTSPPKFF
jgi:hypothetical protein